jgi:predicted dehydrogenase
MARIHLVVGPEYGNWIIPELASILRSADSAPVQQDVRRDRVRRELGAAPPEIFEGYMDMFGVWSHDINLYRAAFPAAPTSIKAHCSPDGTTVTATMQYADGFQCVFQGASTSVHRFEESLTVWGSDRIVTLEVTNPFLQNAPTTVRVCRDEASDDGAATRAAAREEVITGSYEEAFRSQLVHFYRCVTEPDMQPLTNVHESLMDTRLMIDIMRAAAAADS